MIKAWIEKNLVGTSDPRAHGKGLTSNRSGQWRYRVGDYRILADIQDDTLIILVIDIGHRSKIYD
ncbi:MAG: type II toxin-antitoxin system RelE/ParE family toxin [Lachnospiraceae bacterium]|nr:type II toxin-antitoxin system RelE/ParE family toxin [Lachnospiraceae bacterium]